jgi:hypothetical protein
MSVTAQMLWLEPRSTSSHCGSENALDQRVPVFPSTAFAAGKLAFSSEEAVAVLFSATFVVPQVAAFAMGAAAREIPATRADRMRAAQARRLVALLARGLSGVRDRGADLARFRWGRSCWSGISTMTSGKLTWVK